MKKEFRKDDTVYFLRDCTVNGTWCVYLEEVHPGGADKVENILFNCHVSEFDTADDLVDYMQSYPDEMSSYDDDLEAAIFEEEDDQE